MKTKTLIIFFAATLFFTACDKNDSNPDNPASAEMYINTNAGSSWTYHEENSTTGNSNYTVTSTSRDTTINSRKYHVFDYSYGGSQYLSFNDHKYYNFDSIPIGSGITVELLYLKDNLDEGATWEQDFAIEVPGYPASLPAKITNTIVEKGITRTVNNIEYKNVVHVSSSLSSSAIPPTALTSSIDSYYAENYGLIENTTIVHLDYLVFNEEVNISTSLTSSVLK